MEKIQVGYALHDAAGTYSKFLGASMWSLLENTTAPVVIHLLHDHTLSPENREKFLQLVVHFGQNIEFYDMDRLAGWQVDLLHQKLPATMQSRFSPAAFYRLMLDDVLPTDVQRIIYLDADTIVQMDLAQMWQEDPGPTGLAAVAEYSITGEELSNWVCCYGGVDSHRYFNSGVMLLDRKRLFQGGGLLKRCVEFLRTHPQCQFVDQDALNFFFGQSYHVLHARYNMFVHVQRWQGIHVIQPGIYHFDSCSLGMFVPEDCYDRLFYQIFLKTPWCDVDFLMRTFSMMVKIHDQQKTLIQRAFALGANNRCVFCAADQDRDKLCQLFQWGQKDDFLCVVDAKGRLRWERLLMSLRQQGEQGTVHLLFVKGYDVVKERLEGIGFQEKRDFLDGRDFLQKDQGGLELYDPLILRLI